MNTPDFNGPDSHGSDLNGPDTNRSEWSSPKPPLTPPEIEGTDASNEYTALWALLDARSEQLDAPTLDRLRSARRKALTNVGARRMALTRTWVAGAAFAGLAALMLWPQSPDTAIPPAPVSMDAFSALAFPDQVEVLESMDFYLWVESQDALSDEHG
ncbi:MAG: DUF3619 family protein [Pseudomarimonas sp.]